MSQYVQMFRARNICALVRDIRKGLHMMRKGILFSSFLLMLASLSSGATAMSQTPSPPLSATCIASGKASGVPAGLCEAFTAALVASGLQVEITPQGQPTDLTLVVLDVASGRLTARIDT